MKTWTPQAMKRSTQTPKTVETSKTMDIENYGAIDLVSEQYVRINLEAQNYGEIYLGNENYAETNLDFENYSAIDPDA